VLVANPSLPVNNLSELISYARKNPGKLSYASVGNGSSQHIEMEMLKQAAGLFIVHVPYRGSAPAVTDLLGGQVQLMFNGISPTLQHIRAGKLKALAVDSEKRVPLLKDVPTVAESGLPNLRFTTWSGLLVPARTPKPVVDRLTAEMQKITLSPEFREKLASMGLEAGGPTGAAYASFLKADMGDWARMVKQSNAKLD
jgi:tripartite-type tricarboxylate transporter receptor subunit TctC